jgi:hypothetical protein
LADRFISKIAGPEALLNAIAEILGASPGSRSN